VSTMGEPTPCHCPQPAEGASHFWCDVHQCRKTAAMQQQCAGNAQLRSAWEAGHGPGQVLPAVKTIASQGVPVSAIRQQSRWRVVRFAQALWKHAGDWFRKCSRKEIEQRLAICRQCDQFSGTACVRCGCPVNLEKRFRNKLAWRSESCPLGKWPALNTLRGTIRRRKTGKSMSASSRRL